MKDGFLQIKPQGFQTPKIEEVFWTHKSIPSKHHSPQEVSTGSLGKNKEKQKLHFYTLED